MEIIQTPEEALEFVRNLRRGGATLGVVPTMGALHRGHLSLVEASVRRCDHTIATIFVNPTQFASGEDLDKYPRTIEEDLQGLEAAGAAAVFCPVNEVMYPPGFSTLVRPPTVGQPFEGEFRPLHFEGVATIVLKLFQILPGSHAFFGQKDYQQFLVIAAMVRDLNVPIEIIACPIVREPDGLALSSRNRYLDATERSRALVLSKALHSAHQAMSSGETDPIEISEIMRRVLLPENRNAGVDSVDYAAVVDPVTLQPIDRIGKRAVCLIAARVGTTRLIDNQIWKGADRRP